MRISEWLETLVPAETIATGFFQSETSRRLTRLRQERNFLEFDGSLLDASDFGEQTAAVMRKRLEATSVGLLVYSGSHERFINLILHSVAKRHLAAHALVLIDNADLASVYEGIREVLIGEPAYRFEELVIDTDDVRPGQGLAVLSFDRDRTEIQPVYSIPANKNRCLGSRFSGALAVRDVVAARRLVDAAVSLWTPAEEQRAHRVHDLMAAEFPDGASPKGYWHDAWESGFTGFFTWGHDQDFGFGLNRPGAMGTRHLEIVSESVAWDYLPEDLSGLDVLDIGCWSGGDVLALAGLGARVTALEEHPVSARAAQRLCELLEVSATVHRDSLYNPRAEWRGRFDIVYLSGVIYHVTDPLLALRICFAYLKPGGRIVLETKACKLEGPYCEYSGTQEKGWNWFAPTLESLGRWLVDAGFPRDGIRLHMRPIGRLLAAAEKAERCVLPETAGFSRPGSWLEREC